MHKPNILSAAALAAVMLTGRGFSQSLSPQVQAKVG
jgi:hypothetical protein